MISNLKFDENLQEGQRTSILCSVTSGDLPINIVWLKDGLPIPNHLKVTENRVSFLSVLAFDELSEDHSGEYTCSAENEAKNVKQVATLLVKGNDKIHFCLGWRFCWLYNVLPQAMLHNTTYSTFPFHLLSPVVADSFAKMDKAT